MGGVSRKGHSGGSQAMNWSISWIWASHTHTNRCIRYDPHSQGLVKAGQLLCPLWGTMLVLGIFPWSFQVEVFSFPNFFQILHFRHWLLLIFNLHGQHFWSTFWIYEQKAHLIWLLSPYSLAKLLLHTCCSLNVHQTTESTLCGFCFHLLQEFGTRHTP